MSDTPEGGTRAIYTGEQPNPVLNFLRQPRITLLILAAWSLLGVITEALTTNSIFLDNHNIEMDGAIGGFALGWEGIPLAVLYVYCFRSPDKHRNVFWLGLIHMGSLAASQVYHLGTGDFSFESVAVPLFGSAGIGVLAFLNGFFEEQKPEPVPQPARD
jgi:hypothetical protein